MPVIRHATAILKPTLAKGLDGHMTTDIINILMSGIFYASTLFLLAAGLQLVFGVQKIFNLACGSLYALGAYTGVVFVEQFHNMGISPLFSIVPLILAGLSLFFVGIIIERGLLKFVYERDESFQLLLTFAVVLMIEDIIRFIWGTSPKSTSGVYLVYGQIHLLGSVIPVYNLIVILSSLLIAVLIGFMLMKTRFGRIIRATADDRQMGEALGVNMRIVYIKVFTLGTVLGTLGGALVIPTTAAMTEMGVELIVMAFAVVVIGGLGSMKGAFFGAMVVGILRSFAISTYPELELLLIYLIVIGVLVFKPEGLFGGSRA
jgi:branched-chain amino acid transport system permease protein